MLYGNENSDFNDIYVKNFINIVKDPKASTVTDYKIIHFSKNQDMYNDISNNFSDYSQHPYNVDFRSNTIQFCPLQRIASFNYDSMKDVAINICLNGFEKYLKDKDYTAKDRWIILGALRENIESSKRSTDPDYLYDYSVLYYNFTNFIDTLTDPTVKTLLYNFANDTLKRLAESEDDKACNISANAINKCICGSTTALFIQPCNFRENIDKNQDIRKLSQESFMDYLFWYTDQKLICDYQDFLLFLDDFQDCPFDLKRLGKRQKVALVVVGIRLKNGEKIEDYKKKHNIKTDLEYQLQ